MQKTWFLHSFSMHPNSPFCTKPNILNQTQPHKHHRPIKISSRKHTAYKTNTETIRKSTNSPKTKLSNETDTGEFRSVFLNFGFKKSAV